MSMSDVILWCVFIASGLVQVGFAQTPPKRGFPINALPFDLIKLPNGFRISLFYNQTIPGVRNVVLGPYNASQTIVFASSAGAGSITAITDTNDDGVGDARCVIYTSPGSLANGMAYDATTDTLYVGEMGRIIKLENAGATAQAGCIPATDLPKPVTLYTVPPPASLDTGHGRRSLALSQDRKTLYFSVAGPGNLGNGCTPPLCTVQTLDVANFTNTNDTLPVTYAQGLRNPAGLTIDPRTGDLWSAIMSRDLLWVNERDAAGNSFSDNAPDDLVYKLSTTGNDYKFPYCHFQGTGDPYRREPGSGSIVVDDTAISSESSQTAPPTKTLASWNATFGPWCSEAALPAAQALGPHVAPIGLTFYNPPWKAYTALEGEGEGGRQVQTWPEQWSGDGVIFVGEHGSWNRKTAIGYRVAMLRVDDDGVVQEHKVFAEGWLQGSEAGQQWYWGRPVDVLTYVDGSLLITDDDGGVVYKVSYDPSYVAPGPTLPNSGGLSCYKGGDGLVMLMVVLLYTWCVVLGFVS